jgi:uncharacterized protein YbjT (DUF2867 family)
VDGLLETHFVTEQAVIASGLPWTLIRMNIYADSQLDALRHAVASGVHAATDGAPYAFSCVRTWRGSWRPFSRPPASPPQVFPRFSSMC